jgi:hypothetical protein
MKTNGGDEQKLIQNILSYKRDPLGFVLYAFPWGVKNTPLSKFKRPRRWQIEEFEKIKRHLEDSSTREQIGLLPEVMYLAISSGRGPGKSAFLAMLDCWFMSCWIGGTNIKTANTETQLRSRTMAELGKWHGMMINRHWFEKSSMSLRPHKWFSRLLTEQLGMDTQYYYTEAQTWSDDNPDAFAGAHSQVGMMVQFDEASGIPDNIWSVTEGFFTDASDFRLWVVISNPRRNTGQFYECFHKNKDRWSCRYIDSRTVEGVDVSVYQRIADQYGEDHDVTRVEVKGEFPRTGSNQFIGREDVLNARDRVVDKDMGEPLIMGVDVARFGDDESVIRFRRGRDARSIPAVRFKGIDTMQLSDEVAKLINRYNPDGVMIDGTGVGGGVVDRLKQMRFRVIEVQSSERAGDPDKHNNKRVEMWANMKDWLSRGCIDDHAQLFDDLTCLLYEIDNKGRIRLETKEKLKARGMSSPNEADALALTFARPVARIDRTASIGRRDRAMADSEYDEFGV